MDSDDPKFRGSSDDIRRVFKYRKDLKFIAHRPPQVNYHYPNVIRGKDIDVFIYHFSYCLRKQVRDKVKYYMHDLEGHRHMNKWYHDFYIRWTPINREELEGNPYGVWPPDKTSKTVEFKGKLPQVVEEIELWKGM
jgi:hypothetical protein